MSRGLWFVAGAGAGVYTMLKARRAAEAFTPEGFGDRLAALGVGAQLFAEEVRAGMIEKEADLRDRLGWQLGAPPALAGAGGFETLARASSSTNGAGAGASSSTNGDVGTSTDGPDASDGAQTRTTTLTQENP